MNKDNSIFLKKRVHTIFLKHKLEKGSCLRCYPRRMENDAPIVTKSLFKSSKLVQDVWLVLSLNLNRSRDFDLFGEFG